MEGKKKKRLRLLFAIFLAAVLLLSALGVFIFKKRKKKIFKGVAQFAFNQPDALRGWEEKIFKGRVEYKIKKGFDGWYLNAESRNAASGYLRWLKFNPEKSPMVSWEWKVVKFPTRLPGVYEDNWWVEKDDYAARFYLIFPRFPFFRMQCLEYVWDESLPKDKVLSNPNFSNLKVIVVVSGKENLGKWVRVERNIYEDFKKCFGTKAPNVGAIAIMTDADNTASTAVAQYKNFEVGYEK